MEKAKRRLPAAVVIVFVVAACGSPIDELGLLDPGRAAEVRTTCAGLDYPIGDRGFHLDSREDCETTLATMARTQAALRALEQRIRRIQIRDQGAGS